MFVGVFALFVMLVGSDASYALARNLRLGPVLLGRSPALGPSLEALLLALASALPGPVAKVRLPDALHGDRRVLAPVLAGGIAVVLAGVLCCRAVTRELKLRTVLVIRSARSAARVVPSLPALPSRRSAAGTAAPCLPPPVACSWSTSTVTRFTG